MAIYKGSIELASGLIPKNGNDFPLVTARHVQVDDSGTRLDEVLAGGGGGIVKFTSPVLSISGSVVKLEHEDSRCACTSTEQSFSVFTVNKNTKKIYVTKIGYDKGGVFPSAGIAYGT